ncbi:DNA damage inducible 1 homolog rngo [Arctopsyche grandis]|uniref:DNA damage inducible 1 homolog rngo n=1 Tax=Arctopsyche grandis TaxID=121162 RepID=UPI00406DA262
MKVTVTTLSDDIFTLDVSEDLELDNFKAFCEVESGCPANQIVLNANGRLLRDDKKTLKELGIRDGDIVVLQRILQPGASSPSPANPLPHLDFSSIRVPGVVSNPHNPSFGAEDDPKVIRDMFLANAEQLALLKQNNPRLADALLTGSLESFSAVLKEQVAARADRQHQRIRMMNSDPFDTEAQRLIAEEIRQKNIDANMEAAMEYNPETFGTVVMLYIHCHVNGFPVKAFIDSGAQTTIMSAKCAERCNIMRLVDTRFCGIAKGVGVQRIIGRIHMVQIRIEKDFLTTSFSVLEDQPMDMILGLDMLKRHQCNIDLKTNVLRIGTTGTETTFLAEGELPRASSIETEIEESLLLQGNSALRNNNPSTPSMSIAPSTDGAGTSTQTSVNTNEPTVRELMNLGFSREQVETELQRCGGDKTQAMAALFAKSLRF